MLGQLLNDEDADVREAAAQALGELGEHAKEQVSLLGQLLNDEDADVREAAARALGKLGEHAKEQIPLLIDSLVETTSYRFWLFTDPPVIQALKLLGEHAKEQVPLLIQMLTDERFGVREAAIKALGAFGEHSGEQIPLLAELLNDDDADTRKAVARVMEGLGEHAKEHAPLLAERLSDDREYWFVRNAAVRSLEALAPLPLRYMPSILVHRYNNPSRTGEIRFLAHFLGGGSREVETLLAWLGGPSVDPMNKLKNREDADETLSVFRKVWSSSRQYPPLHRDLAYWIGKIITESKWTVDDQQLLRWFERRLRNAEFTTEAEALRRKINAIKTESVARRVVATLVLHATFWLALIFAYPKFPQVQAIFFWNRWVRWLAGLGYVSFLLTWVPFLRRRLFSPFKQSLLADARIAEADEKNYFEGSTIQMQNGELHAITEAISQIRGQMILEGDSGLGKSMFLRHLVRNYKSLIVFVLATDCHDSVLEAIQVKLEGTVRDPNYLRKLIYAGALDIVIDGLNEASPDTRARIVDFAKRFSRGNLLLATQPMVWEPPPLSKIYVMQYLTESQIEQFLISRFATLSADTQMTKNAFAEYCRNFLRGTLDDTLSKERRDAVRRILSNPMDLTVVAQMLANGHAPNLFELQQQYFQLMTDDYRRHQPGDLAFPLREFAEHVYEMRLNDTLAFGKDEFVDELTVMARHKMVVPFHRSGTEQLWTFRHDKIMDFFLVQAFLGGDNDRPSKHFDDSRFRGTYMQLANILPLDDAEALERKLIDHAADTKDHSVSDEFIQLLRSRKAA